MGRPKPDGSPSPPDSDTSSSSSSSSGSSSGESWNGFSDGDQADDQENVVVSAGQRLSDEMGWDQPSMNLDERGWRYVAIREIIHAAHYADIGYLEDVVRYSNERLSAESLACSTAHLEHPEQTTFRCPHILTGPDTGHA